LIEVILRETMAARQAANPRIWRNAPFVEVVDMADNNPSEDLESEQAEDAEDSDGERDGDEEGDGEEDEDEEEEVQGEADPGWFHVLRSANLMLLLQSLNQKMCHFRLLV
jgi:hypothetical protein